MTDSWKWLEEIEARLTVPWKYQDGESVESDIRRLISAVKVMREGLEIYANHDKWSSVLALGGGMAEAFLGLSSRYQFGCDLAKHALEQAGRME